MKPTSVNRSVRIRIARQRGCPRDLGPWCVVLEPTPFFRYHVARHSTKRSALARARRIRAVMRGER